MPKEKDRVAAAFPKSGQVQLNQSARALRQAGAGPEGKVRLLLPSARSDFTVANKYLPLAALSSVIAVIIFVTSLVVFIFSFAK
ncbi:MAG: hypothetical protein WA322_19555 [Pseudolabrys sp.]